MQVSLSLSMTRIVPFITVLLVATGLLVGGAQTSCTHSTLLDSGKKCVSKFFKMNRQEPQGNCSTMYQKLRGCIHKAATQCIKDGTEPMKGFNAGGVWQLAHAFAASEDLYCVKGMFDSSSYVTVEKLSDCKKKLFKVVKKCDKRFHRVYQGNRSSSTLCRKYSESQRCVRKYIKKFCPHDSPEAENVRRLYKESFNPHCKGNTDTRRKRKGRRKGVSSDQPVKVGRCAVGKFFNDSRKCISKFYQALRKDLLTSCGKVFEGEFIPCLRALYKNCSMDMESEATVQRRKSTYCNMGLLRTLSSKFCKSAYFRELPACSAAFRRKFNINRGDTSLCREYSKAKHCSRNVTLTYCQMNKLRKASVDYYYNKFNPFCANSQDQKPTSIRDSEAGKQNKPTEKAVSSGTQAIGSATTLFITEVIVLNFFMIK